jgi:hypothetical protein
MGLEFECIVIEKGEGASAILGHAGFIKTVEDLREAMVGSVPGVKFGIAFAEASGPSLLNMSLTSRHICSSGRCGSTVERADAQSKCRQASIAANSAAKRCASPGHRADK